MKLKKVVLSCENKDVLQDLGGLKPVPTFARKSIAGLNIRQGQPMGFIGTLRGKKMHRFIERFCNVLLPADRRFRGIPTPHQTSSYSLTIGFSDSKRFSQDNGRRAGLSISFVFDTRLPAEFQLSEFVRSFVSPQHLSEN